MNLTEPVKRWIKKHAPHTFGHWHDGRQPFRDAAEEGIFAQFLDALMGVRAAIVGGPHLARMAERLGTEFIEIPAKNCWLAYDKMYEDVLAFKGDVVTFSAAMTSEVIIPNLWKDMDGRTTLIDAGSIFDPLCGAPSRSWHGRWIRDIMRREKPKWSVQDQL